MRDVALDTHEVVQLDPQEQANDAVEVAFELGDERCIILVLTEIISVQHSEVNVLQTGPSDLDDSGKQQRNGHKDQRRPVNQIPKVGKVVHIGR